ncbi:MAG: PadR family transcriptional regulator [Rubrobacteraceae bacterium]
MNRSSQTRLAVLGMIAVDPSSGYAVRESISRTIGHFWNASFGQIYPTLADLERDGFIEVVDRDGRKKVFGITEAGLDELRSLLSEPVAQTPLRDATLLRLFYGRFLGDESCLRLIGATALAAEQQLASFDKLEETLKSDYVDHPDLPFWLLTLRSGQLAAQAKRQWAREAEQLLQDRRDEQE